MAKKQEETVSLVKTFEEFNETKKIDRNTLMRVLEESFRIKDDKFKALTNHDWINLAI